MRQVQMDESSELGEFFRSGGVKRPAHSKAHQSFSYERPEMKPGKTRGLARLATTDILFGAVQVFKAGGGERVMHSHSAMDGFWFVLGGRVRFHFGDGTSKDCGKHEGVCVPRDVEYWFESTSEEPLELLQVESLHPNVPNELVTQASDEQVAESVGEVSLYDALEATN